jgi:hypothetical protein
VIEAGPVHAHAYGATPPRGIAAIAMGVATTPS